MILSYNPNLYIFVRPLQPPSNPEYIYAFFCIRWIEMVIQRLKKLEAVIFFLSPLILSFLFLFLYVNVHCGRTNL